MRTRVVITLASLLLLCVSIPLVLWVASGSFKVCVPAPLDESNQKTIAALDGIVDLGLTLSTTLIGVGAALLIGLKSGLKITLTVKVIILVATVFFVQSALYAVWWRLGVAEIWLNQCFNLLTAGYMQRRFEAHLVHFFLGLGSLGLLVIGALFAIEDTGGDT